MKFEEMNLRKEIAINIKRLGFVEPTEVQESTIIPAREGRDIVAQSATGTGKTAAFGIPMLEKMEHNKGIQALILTPTRELCYQVADNLIDLGRGMNLHIAKIYGGVGMNPQIDALKIANIVVATPGRMLDHLRNKYANFTHVKMVVLDEADRMLEMGFIDDVSQILSQLPKVRQTLLFSATIPSSIGSLINRFLNNPVHVKVHEFIHESKLRHVYYNLQKGEKFGLLVHLLKNKTPGLAIVFCATKIQVDVLARNLKVNGIQARAIHGGLSQNKRTSAIDDIKDARIDVLVATDIAARGLDIKDISHIYNYDVPKSSEDYTHRVGRTARAGKEGDAVTLLSERDYSNFDNVLRDHSIVIKAEDVPKFERVRFMQHSEDRMDRNPRGRGGFRGRPQGGSFGRGSSFGRGRSGPSHGRGGFSRGRGDSGRDGSGRDGKSSGNDYFSKQLND